MNEVLSVWFKLKKKSLSGLRVSVTSRQAFVKHLFVILLGITLVNFTKPSPKVEEPIPESVSTSAVQKVQWSEVDTIDITALNADLVKGKPTMDLGVYFPSNFDPDFQKVSLEELIISIRAAKEIYQPTGVQLNVLWIKTGEINPKYLAIQANEVPGIPLTEYINIYKHKRRHPAQLTQGAAETFEAIIEPKEDSDRTLYVLILQDVFYPFLTVAEGRKWTMKTVRTGGFSFPTYSYVDQIPSSYRGVITITNLTRPDRLRDTIAHEIGHKVMNVSHEYRDISPQHEVYADGGLMLYGDGEDIPSGREGRWHLERLHLSPFLYTLQADGIKKWNPDYQEGGHYYDPIYGDKVVHFKGVAPIDEDW